jgi:hypothetical protein
MLLFKYCVYTTLALRIRAFVVVRCPHCPVGPYVYIIPQMLAVMGTKPYASSDHNK